MRPDGGEFDPTGPPEGPPTEEIDVWETVAPASASPTPRRAAPVDPGALREAFDYLVDDDSTPPKK